MTAVLQGIYTVFLEMLCLQKLMEIFGEYKSRTARKYRGFMLLLLVVCLFITARVLGNVLLVKVIVVLGVEAVIVRAWFDISMRKIVLYAALLEGMLLVVDYIVMVLCPHIFYIETSDAVQFFTITFGRLLILLLIVLAKKYVDESFRSFWNEADGKKLLVVPISVLAMIVAIWANKGFLTDSRYREILWAMAFFLLGTNILTFYLMYGTVKKEKRLWETQLAMQQVQNQLSLYEAATENLETQRRKMHEYKNQIECMQMLVRAGRYKELEEYLNQAGGLCESVEVIETHHAVINAVLNAKYQQALEREIVVTLMLNNLSGVWLATNDIVVLLSNLLDNAIEASSQCAGDKRIEFKFLCENHQLVLGIRNTYQENARRSSDGSFVTSKEKGENHGYGIRNVIDVVKKYEGSYVVTPDEELFGFYAVFDDRK